MRFVETKTPEQQSCLMLHRTRHLFIRLRTAVINAIRAHLAEFGIVAPVGAMDLKNETPRFKRRKISAAIAPDVKRFSHQIKRTRFS
jgi:hypothetical protein